MLRSICIVTVLIPASVFPVSAVLGDEKSTPATKITFEDHVKPIFRAHCATCHHQGEKRGGLAVDTFASVMEGGGSGEIVYDDGDVDGSRLWQLVNHDDTPVMPPGQPKIPQADLDVLRAWIEGGALENNGSAAKPKKKNALAYVAPSSGRPEGPPPMPQQLPQQVPVVSDRAAATTAIGTSPWAPLVAVAGQRQVSLYNTDSGELLGVLPFDEGIPQSLRFSRDGNFLIAGGGEHSVRGVAVIYDIRTGERIATIGDELDTIFDADANDRMSRVAMGGPKRMLRIFDATDGTLLFDIKKHTDWILAVAFSPDGVLVASADRSGGLCVWEADTGRLYLDLIGHKGAVNSLSWRDDSNVLASASDDGTVKLWDMVSGNAIKSLNAHGPGVMSVAFDHQGQIATAGKDKVARLWDASGQQIMQSDGAAESMLEVAVTHDSSRVVYGDWTGQVLVSTVADPKQVQPLAANPPPAKDRLPDVRRTVAEIQARLSPLVAAKQAAAEKVAEIDASRQVAVASQLKTKAEIDAAIAQNEQAGQAVAAILAALPDQVSGSRDQQDLVIAARLQVDDASADSVRKLAALESQLAASVQAIADARLRQLQLRDETAARQQTISKQQTDLAAIESQITAITDSLAVAKTELQTATAAAEIVAAELSRQQSLEQQLIAAIQ